jgi:hypothetical protein
VYLTPSSKCFKKHLTSNSITDTPTRHQFDEDKTEENELQFTKNVVVLEISGGPTDLTLIDLPGIIRNTEKEEDRRYIPLIQDLVKEYIHKDNAIIVAAVTCSDDIANQVESDCYGSGVHFLIDCHVSDWILTVVHQYVINK